MAPLMYLSFRKVLVLSLVIMFLFSTILISAYSEPPFESSSQSLGTRKLFELEKDQNQRKKIKPTNSLSSKNQTKLIKPPFSSSKNQTKLIKSSLSSKNQTKLIKPPLSSSKNQTKLIKSSLSSKNQTKVLKPNLSSKNQTKLIKSSSNSTKTSSSTTKNIELKKLNSTSKSTNSTKPNSIYSKKISDLTKPSTPKDKTTKPTTTTKQSQNPPKTEKKLTQQKPKKPIEPSWIDQEGDADFVSDFTDLPGKFQQTLIPDLERISTTSKIYLDNANKQMTQQLKPIVGNKYAATTASIVSCAFLLIPLLLVSLLFNRIKAYFSLQKLLIFIQIYLSIYFSILCLSSLVTGLEPLKFFYVTSQSTYICLQALQTLGYVLYLLLLLMYLILVFSTDSGLTSKVLGLAQTFVGFSVGLHYYMSVFHRAVLRQPPKTNWKVHGIYAMCFLVICLFATAERRKKAYLEEGGEEGKKS